MNLARLILPAIRWQPGQGFLHDTAAIEAALDRGVGGFIIFGVPGGSASELRELTDYLQRRAGRPLLLAADLERGAGQQFTGLTDLPPPAALASLADPELARWAGSVTAREARAAGINWVLAPVADLDSEPLNPIVQTRAFGSNPSDVARCVAAWIAGCQESGAPACAKHYPGHGRTRTDSHAGVPVVSADRELLEREDLGPFGAAIEAGVAAVMTAHVAYPALDPRGTPATFSMPILGRLRATGFAGAIVTDALIMEGARDPGELPPELRALEAGCDLLLYPPEPLEAARSLERAARRGVLSEARLAESLGRYESILAAAHRPAQRAEPTDRAKAADVASRLIAAGRRGPEPNLRPPCDLVVVDDDIGGPYPPGPSDWVARGLAERGVPLGPGGSRVVLVFAEPRAWKGRAGLSAENQAQLLKLRDSADLVVIFGHPRLVDEVPTEAPVVIAWHRQRLMQDAVARYFPEP